MSLYLFDPTRDVCLFGSTIIRDTINMLYLYVGDCDIPLDRQKNY